MIDDLKKIFGDDYPKSVTVLGRHLPLEREGRFSRYYYSEEQRHGAEVSKFEDGSASISLDQLKEGWAHWSKRDKRDFLSASNALFRQADYPEMLRFLMTQDDPDVWSGIAMPVGGCLPQDEAFELLNGALNRVESHTANITQGISITRHPKAAASLRGHLDKLWSHPQLWDDDPFTNWPAFDAICCIAHLLDLGVDSADLEPRVRALSKHACAGTRDSCGTFLSKYYPWIPTPDLGALGLPS